VTTKDILLDGTNDNGYFYNSHAEPDDLHDSLQAFEPWHIITFNENQDPYYCEMDFVDSNYDIYHISDTKLWTSCEKSSDISSPTLLLRYSINEGVGWLSLSYIDLTTDYTSYSRTLTSVNMGNIDDIRVGYSHDGTYRPLQYNYIRKVHMTITYTTTTEAQLSASIINKVNVEDNNYSVDWTAKSGDVHYYVYYEHNGSGFTGVYNVPTIYNVSNALYGRHKYYVVNFNNYSRNANPSLTISTYVCPPPSSVTISDSLKDEGKLTINWGNVIGNDPNGWKVAIHDGSWGADIPVSSTSRSYTFSGLTNRIAYKLRVKAYTTYGDDQESSYVETTTKYVANGWQGTIMGRTNPDKIGSKSDHDIDDYVCDVLDDDVVP